MQGGIMDGIAQALTSSLHLRDGHFLEGSWDNYWYTRQWNVPLEVNVIVMPATTSKPGGAGEFGVAATQAAVACALRAARPARCRPVPDQPQQAARLRAAADRRRRSRRARSTACDHAY